MTKNIKMTLVSVALAALLALAASAAVPGFVSMENPFPSAAGMLASPSAGGGSAS